MAPPCAPVDAWPSRIVTRGNHVLTHRVQRMRPAGPRGSRRADIADPVAATGQSPAPTRHTGVHAQRARPSDSWPRRFRPPASRPDVGLGRSGEIPRTISRGAGAAGGAAQAAAEDDLARRGQGSQAAQAAVHAAASQAGSVGPADAEGGRRPEFRAAGAQRAARPAAVHREDGRDTYRLRRPAHRLAPARPRPPLAGAAGPVARAMADGANATAAGPRTPGAVQWGHGPA